MSGTSTGSRLAAAARPPVSRAGSGWHAAPRSTLLPSDGCPKMKFLQTSHRIRRSPRHQCRSSWTAWETIRVSTVSRSRVELTAWPTSPSAFSSPTDRANSWVRCFQFLEQPHVLDGDDGLIGKGFEQFDLRRVKGRTSMRRATQRSNKFSLLAKGNGQDGCAKPVTELTIGKSFCSRRQAHEACHARASSEYRGSSILISTRSRYGYGTKVSPRNHPVSLAEA